MPSATTRNLPSRIDKNFIRTVALICFTYLAFQLLYIPYAKLAVDEFWFAHHIYQYTHSLPYRDFPPYKTVLGYYLLMLPFYLSHAVITPLFYIKDEIAIVNTLLLGITLTWLPRFFQPKAILAAALLISCTQLFLLYSVELRVDMLTSWLGLIAVLFFLSHRPALAGISLAASFLISQKALWYFMAMNGAIGIYWFTVERNWHTIKHHFLFNVAIAITIFSYIVFWSLFTSHSTVLQSMFYEAYVQATINWYQTIYYTCWQNILSSEPLLFVLWPLTWVSLFIYPTQDANRSRRVFISAYAAIMMLFIFNYKQPFPYNMVFSIPVFFLLYSDFFSWLFTILGENKLTFDLNSRVLFCFFSLYITCIISVIIIFDLPKAYYLILFIPFSISQLVKIITPETKSIYITLLALTFLFTGCIYPLLRFSIASYAINGKNQQYMVNLTHDLLSDNEDFIAGIPLLYNKNQPTPGLRNLIGPQIDYLHNGAAMLKPLLIPSLYLTPTTSTEIIQSLKKSRVKLYVNNARIMLLPHDIRQFLDSEYLHFLGDIYLYAPKIAAGKETILIKFSGNYKVISKNNTSIVIDGKEIRSNLIINLSSGTHSSLANQDYRLKLLPTTNIKIDPKYDISDMISRAVVI